MAKSDVRVLVQIRNEVSDLIGLFGFEIKEWLSNDNSVGTLVKEMKIIGIRYNVEWDYYYYYYFSSLKLVKKIQYIKKIIIKISSKM